MSLFSSQKEGELDLILDVQSAVVRGSLVLYKESSAPHVVFTYNANVPWKPHTDTSYLIKTTLKAITETIDAARRNAHIRASSHKEPKRIRTVHFVLSAPWIVSEAKTISIAFNKETTLSKEYVLKAIETERAKLTEAGENNLTTIENKIFDVRLNGYSVKDWQGKSAKNIDISYSASVAGARMIERFHALCSHATHGCKIEFHSSLLLQHIGLSDIMPNADNYGLLHVHGELTEIALISNHITTFFGSFPNGVRTVVREISTATKTDFQSADSLLTLYVGGHLDKEHADGQTQAVQNISTGWSSDLKKILVGQISEFTMPTFIAISAWAHDDFFAQSLHEVYPKVKIDIMSIDDILPHLTFEDNVERRRLTGLYALAIHIMKKQ